MSDAATQPYLASYERLARHNAQPGWLRERRREGIERFADFGFPTTDLEDWKYTPVRAIAKAAPCLEAVGDKACQARDVEDALGSGFRGSVLVFANGRYAPELSSTAELPDGAIVDSLAAALAKHPERAEPCLARVAGATRRAQSFVALNTALFSDGAFVYLPPGAAPAAPIALVFLAANGESAWLQCPRVLIVAEAGSRATVIESYAGAGGAPYLTNAVSEIVCGEGAAIDHVKLQRESDAAFHVATLQAHQERDSRFRSCAISFGAALARSDVNSRVAAPGAEVVLNGLFVATADQHVDHHTEIDHAQPNGQSRELYKGILAGKAVGVFNGKIIVRPQAQHTNAQQTNKNLLVSEDASINSKPQLEIQADDVRCTHGSTIGHLDALSLFYLRSRGLADAEARALLTRGFAAEVTESIEPAPLRARVEQLLHQRLALPAPAETA